MTTKKIIALIAGIACCAATAFAADTYSGTYKGRLSMSGTMDLGESNVDIYPGSADGHVTFVLPDFNFLGNLPVGNIVLIDVPVSDGNLTLDSYPLYIPALKPLGQALVNVSFSEGSAFKGDSLSANLGIEIPGMGAVPVTFKGERLSAGFQVPNGGFEEWETVTSEVKPEVTGTEPLHWNSFASATSSNFLTNMAINGEQLRDSAITRPGSEGQKSALVTSKWQIITAANGNLTTGRINAGSITPADPANTNKSDPANADEYKCPFYGNPDSLAVWVKYRPADGDIANEANKAGVRAVIHRNLYYQDPEDSTVVDGVNHAKYDTVKVAEAVASYSAKEGYAWQRLSIPFAYLGSEQAPKDSAKWIIVSFSTNLTPGGGTTTSTMSDSIFVDDLSIIYNPARLTSLKVGDETISLTEGTYSYKTAQKYNDTTLAVEAIAADGAGVKTFTAFNRNTSQMTVIVRGGDYATNPANAEIYTIEFQESGTTGVDNTYSGIRDNAVICTDGRTLRIETAYTGEISIYSIDGRLITTTVERVIDLPQPGIYLVRIGSETYKAIAR